MTRALEAIKKWGQTFSGELLERCVFPVRVGADALLKRTGFTSYSMKPKNTSY